MANETSNQFAFRAIIKNTQELVRDTVVNIVRGQTRTLAKTIKLDEQQTKDLETLLWGEVFLVAKENYPNEYIYPEERTSDSTD